MVKFNASTLANTKGDLNIENAMTKINETKVTIKKLLKENQKAPKKKKSVDNISHKRMDRNNSIDEGMLSKPNNTDQT